MRRRRRPRDFRHLPNVDASEHQFVDEAGAKLLRSVPAVHVSIDGNVALCRGLVKTRYGEESTR